MSLVNLPVSLRIIVMAMIAAVGLSGCAARGTLGYNAVNPAFAADQVPQTVSLQQIFVATSRKPSGDPEQPFSSARSEEVAFRQYIVSIPPSHEVGKIAWPDGEPDPATDFVVRSEVEYPQPQAFLEDVNRALKDNPNSEGNVSIFIHGYNNNFAEGLYRYAQMLHDYDSNDVAIHYSWPSAGVIGGYVYDRDSSVFARDGLERLLQLVSQSNAKSVTIAAHSLGTLLTMEVLRQLSIEGNGDLDGKLAGLFLLSPDIDEEVFIAQARRLDPTPKPFLVFTSSEDRALKFSSLLTGGQPRLGSIQNTERLQALGVTLVDLSAANDGDGLNHLSAGTSPLAISLIRSLRRNAIENPLDPIDLVAGGIVRLTMDAAGKLVLAGQN